MRYKQIEFRRTTRAVDNPHPDRRSKDWEKQAVIQPGRGFRVVRLLNERAHIPIYGGAPIFEHNPLYAELLAASEAITPDVLWECEAYGIGANELVEELIEAEVVTREQIHDLILKLAGCDAP